MIALPFADWRGNEVNVGSRVLYGRPHGYGVELTEAIVLGVKGKGLQVQPLRSSRSTFGAEHQHREGQTWDGVKPVVLRKVANVTAL